ncbi:MAG: hypothetical protein ACRC11_15515 [Xenococcaceae cyanobacterium]
MERAEVFKKFTQVILNIIAAKQAVLKDDPEKAVQLLNEAIAQCHEIRLDL